MSVYRSVLFVIVLLGPVGGVAAPAATSAIATLDAVWTDASRSRDVPVRIRYPEESAGRLPLVVLSHGLGGSREGLAYLGEALAKAGFVALHLQHAGSDAQVWRGSDRPLEALRAAARQPANAVHRPRDVSFAIDHVLALEGEHPLAGRVDGERIGVAGHSFGSLTALLVAGQKFVWGARKREISVRDDRVKAAVAMSSPVPRDRSTHEKAYAAVEIPVLHMTGTQDTSPIGDTGADERRVPFDTISGVDQYLITFTGGDHMIFSGQALRRRDAARDAMFQPHIMAATVAFFQGYLNRDEGRVRWLREELEGELGEAGVLEMKASEL